MKTTARLRSFLALTGSALLAISYTHAADGTWTQTTAGPFNWGDIANWNSGAGPVADGQDSTAFFTANIAANQTVNLAAPQTIGNITFTDSTTSSHDLTISGANILTLDVTTGLPIIDVTQSGRKLTISSQIAGNDGLQKNGAGTLTISTAPTYTGATTITGGTFDVSAIVGGASPISPLATSSIAFTTANSTFLAAGSGTALVSYPTMSIASGVTARFDRGGGGNNTAFAIPSLTGGGTFSLANGGGAGTNVTFTTLAGFTGNLDFNNTVGNAINTPDLADTASSKITMSSGNATQIPRFNYTGSAGLTLNNRQFELYGTTANTVFGINNNGTASSALTINTNLAVTATGTKTLRLGGTNTGGISTFAGNITNGSGIIGVAKFDANTWVLSGTNTYTGGTTVTNGTLRISNAAALPSNGNLIVTGGTIESTVGAITAARYLATGGTFTAPLGGAGDFYKSGTGTTNLNGANSYSGGTTVQSGTLAVGASGTLGANSSGNSIIIQDSGILTLAAAANSGSDQGITLSSSLNTGAPVLSGGAGPVGRLAVLGLGFNGLPNGAISQANTLGGVIAINAVTGYNTDLSSVLTGKNLFLGAIGTSTFTGAAGTVVAGNDSLYRLGGGGGQITFNTTNLFTGASGVQVGSTFANGGGTVVINAAQDYTGATTVNAGTLTLNGANGAATGSSGFTLNGGRLFLDSSGVVGNNNADRIGNVIVSLRNGGELSLNGNAAGTTEAFGNLSIGSGYSTVTATATTTASTLAGVGFTRTNNGTALFRGTALGTNVAAMGQVTLSDTSGLSYVGANTLDNAASGDITKDVKIIPYLVGDTGTGTGNTFVTYDDTLGFRVLNTTNQFNSTITANTNVRLVAAVTGIATDSINSLIHTTGSSTIADGATLTVTSGAILFTGGNINQAGTTGILDFGANTGFWTTTGNVSIGARITGSGGLVKSGTAQLTLANTNNSYIGGTVLNGGTLATSANGNLGGTGGITVNANATWNMGPASAVSYARDLTVNEGATLTLTSGNAGKTVTGVLSGNGTLFVNHSTDFIFSNADNTFTGAIVSQTAGSPTYGLTFASIGDTAGAGLINLVGGSGTFRWTSASGSTTTLANRQFSISTPGQATISAFGTTAASNLVINQNLLISGEAGARSLRLAGTNTGNNTFAGQINDNGPSVVSLVKFEAGTWILSNANTFSGTTLVSAGTLIGTNATRSFGTNLNGISLAAAGTLSLRNDSSVSFTNGTSAYNIDNTASGATINVDRVTGTGSNTINVGNLTTTSTAASWGLTFTGANGVSLNAGTLNTPVSTAGSQVHTITNNIATTNGASLTLASVFNQATTVASPDLAFAGTGTTIVSGPITQTLADMELKKSGTGTLLLNGINTYTGLTTVSAGTLGGTGTIAGSVTVETNGSLAPGASAGTLSIGGGLTITAMATGTAGKLKFELGANTANSDQIAVAGGLTIGSGVLGFSDFTFTNLPGGPQNGTYVLITSTGITGTLDPDLVDRKGPIGVGGEGEISFSGNNIVLTVTGLGGGTPYQNWATGGELFNDDANNDGVSNGLAFLLGASGPNVSALDKLPTVTESGGGLVLNFNCLPTTARGGAQLRVAHSTTLASWTTTTNVVPDSNVPDGFVSYAVTPGSPLNAVTATIGSGAAAGGKLFGRLQATE